MSHPTDPGCPEFHAVSRRRFVGWTASLLGAAVVPGWLPRAAFADSHNSQRDVLVSIFLRGGCDGLSLCPPYFEPHYHLLRPALALAPPDASAGAALDLDGRFGFAPAMAPLLEAYDAGELLVVHACGQHAATRSHFAAMNFMELGHQDPPGDLITGWLGRHLAHTAPTLADGVLRALALGFGVPRTLIGGPKTLPVPDATAYDLDGDPATRAARRAVLQQIYAETSNPLRRAAQATFDTMDLLRELDIARYQPADGVAYPDGALGQALRATAALVKAEVGLEASAIDYGGWDTHDDQGPIDGNMARTMGQLASGLAALHRDLKADGFDRVTTVVMSEFGRNAFENASRGTDHGHGSVMLVLGTQVDGGRVLTEWPGLEDHQLYEGQDLAVTIDYRDVLAEILGRRLDTADLAAVFPDPDYTPVEQGVIKA